MRCLAVLITVAPLAVAISTQDASAQASNVRYVRKDAPAGGNGQSWTTAYNDVWSGLDHLAQIGGGPWEVWVAAGTYYPRHKTLTDEPTFAIRNNVKIYGGFAGAPDDSLMDRKPDTQITTLSGVIVGGDYAVCGQGQASCFGENSGPGCADAACCSIVCDIDPMCCTIAWDANCAGDAAQLCDPKTGLPKDTRADSVVSTLLEGGNRQVDGFTITQGGDVAIIGGVERPRPNQFSRGGGVRANAISEGGPVELNVVRCRITGNSAWNGGGLALTPITGPDEVVMRAWNCRVEGNFAESKGAGLFSQERSRYNLVNSVVANNSFITDSQPEQDEVGAAVYEDSPFSGYPRSIVNSTITANAGKRPGVVQSGAYQSQLTVANSIVRNNLFRQPNGTYAPCVDGACEGEIFGSGAKRYTNSNFSLAQLGTLIGCINADPGFANATIGNYELLPNTACIDVGGDGDVFTDVLDVNNDNVYLEDGPDVAMRQRIRVATPGACPAVDMGAHELQGHCGLGNMNGDSKVDGADLGLFLNEWGPCSGVPCPGDFNCDGAVDGGDMGDLLGTWGAMYPRNCGLATMSAPMEGAEPSGLTAEDLALALGFETVGEFVAWVSGLPFDEMVFYLDMLAD